MKIAITALSEKNQTVKLIGFDPRTPDKTQSQTINHTAQINAFKPDHQF